MRRPPRRAQTAIAAKREPEPLEPRPPVLRVRVEHRDERERRARARARASAARRARATPRAARSASSRAAASALACSRLRLPPARARARRGRARASAAATCARISSTFASHPSRADQRRARRAIGPPGRERAPHLGDELARAVRGTVQPGIGAQLGQIGADVGEPRRHVLARLERVRASASSFTAERRERDVEAAAPRRAAPRTGGGRPGARCARPRAAAVEVVDLAEQHHRGPRVGVGHAPHQLEVDPVGDQPEEPDHRPRQRARAPRGPRAPGRARARSGRGPRRGGPAPCAGSRARFAARSRSDDGDHQVGAARAARRSSSATCALRVAEGRELVDHVVDDQRLAERARHRRRARQEGSRRSAAHPEAAHRGADLEPRAARRFDARHRVAPVGRDVRAARARAGSARPR